MAYVTPSTQNLKACFQSHFSLPFFQREYKWTPKHFSELLNDIQSAFLLNFDTGDARSQVANYTPYFLGSIVTATEKEGKKPLIDGQQRLTSAFLLLAYLERLRRELGLADALDLTTYLGNRSFGTMQYSIDFSATRVALFNKYLDYDVPTSEALRSAEDVSSLDDGDLKVLECLRTTDAILETDVRSALPYFIDYVVERVLLIEISVIDEAEAHRVFVTMNDRGLQLGPIDLLKGQILSKIIDANESVACHTSWVATVNRLRGIDSEEDSLFFRHLLRGKWADTIRAKTKGAVAGDFDLIGEGYHRWFSENVARVGLSTGDDYIRFARDEIPKYAEVYEHIKKCENGLTPGFEVLYYNASRKASSQAMILLSVVNPTDTTSDWQKKTVLVARLFDLILTTRSIEGKDNNYDNLKDITFSLTKQVRGKDLASLMTLVRTEWPGYFSVFNKLVEMAYARSERSEILFLLARIACHLEESFALTSRVGFTIYWQRDRGQKTFDIEHIFKERFDTNALPPTHGFADSREYAALRNTIGALILLPRSRNRSLQDKSYRDKLAAYATENVLGQTLTASFYQNNPNVAEYVTGNPSVGLKPISDFEKSDINDRASTYTKIARDIWKSP